MGMANPNTNNLSAGLLLQLSGAQPQELQELIVKYTGDITRVAQELNATVEILDQNYAIITLPVMEVPTLYGLPEIIYVERPKNLLFFLADSLRQSCITFVQSEFGFHLHGSGVLVGIIDSGIDYSHPDFRNPDGTTRIAYLWDQFLTGTPPEGFAHGAEFTMDQINAALASPNPLSVVPSQDTQGHGTAVSGIAAGNGRASNGLQVGVAPEATLIVVKLGNLGTQNFARTTEVMRAFKYIVTRAEELNMPVSINLSYGTNDGGHDGNSLFETYIDDITERWRTVASVATGNEGASGHHFSAVIKERESVRAEFVVSGSPQQVYLTLWKNFTDTFSYELISPGGKSTGVLSNLQTTTSATLDNVDITIFYGQPTHYTVAQEIYFLLQGQRGPIPAGFWTLVVTGTQVVDGSFNIWLPTIDVVANETTFLSPDVNITLTLPSTSSNVISVGGYNAVINVGADFSGRGFTRGNVYAKPDLVAPAVDITTARAGGGYDNFTGTSMAAPFVTGSAALMMEWGIVQGNDPFLYGQRVKAFLQRGATRDFLITYPSQLWGWGTLCLNRTMNELVQFQRRGGPV